LTRPFNDSHDDSFLCIAPNEHGLDCGGLIAPAKWPASQTGSFRL
jgi:hypothetical protein